MKPPWRQTDICRQLGEYEFTTGPCKSLKTPPDSLEHDATLTGESDGQQFPPREPASTLCLIMPGTSEEGALSRQSAAGAFRELSSKIS